MKTSPLRSLALIGAALAATSGSARAQTFDEVFDKDTVHEIRLFVNSRDLAELRARYQENVYYPADMQWGDVRVRNIGIRSRGIGSRSPTKLNLRLDFNRYVSGQRFADVQSLQLDNIVQDPSMVHEATAMAFYRRMGFPAPRVSYTRLYINDVYEGLYDIIESIDNRFLMRTFGESAGRLYEYHWFRIYHFEDLGDDLDEYRMFNPENHDTDSTTEQWAPIREMVRSINEPTDAIWVERTDEYINLRQLVAYTAIEQFLAEIDGLNGYAGVANFHLYQMAGTNQHIFLPWDRDRAFERPDRSVLERVNENVLVRQALMYPELMSLFLDVLESCARAAEDDNWLESEIVRTANLIAPHARQDNKKPYDDSAHEDAVAGMIGFARERSANVREQVARIRTAVDLN